LNSEDIHPYFGATLQKKNWVPTPSYLLRRYRILKLLEPFDKGRLIEVGCGAGALLHDFTNMGFECEAVDTSSAAFKLASYLTRDNPKVKVSRFPQDRWRASFDFLAAFEVLEHIEDEMSALNQWASWIRPGGRLVISVPAHSKRWSASDEWAGHYRRYDREQLIELLNYADFSIEHFESYGFPLGYIIEPLRAWHHLRQLKREALAGSFNKRSARTDRSGTERSLECRLFTLQKGRIGTLIIRLFCSAQNFFSDSELGVGYLVIAKRK